MAKNGFAKIKIHVVKDRKESIMDEQNQEMQQDTSEMAVNDLPSPPPAPGDTVQDEVMPISSESATLIDPTPATPAVVPPPPVENTAAELQPANDVSTLITDGNNAIVMAYRDIRDINAEVAQAEEDADLADESARTHQSYLVKIKQSRLDVLRNAKVAVDEQRDRLDRSSNRLQEKIDDLSANS